MVEGPESNFLLANQFKLNQIYCSSLQYIQIKLKQITYNNIKRTVGKNSVLQYT